MRLFMMLFLIQGDGLPADVSAAVNKLKKAPDDHKANMTVGLYYAKAGLWGDAFSFFMKSANEELRKTAKSDLESGDKPADKKEYEVLGDAWIALSKKLQAPLLASRGTYWYSELWFRLGPDERGPLRAKLSKLCQPPVGFEKYTGGCQPPGWHPLSQVWKTDIDTKFARTGRGSAKLLPGGSKDTGGHSAMQSLAVQAVEGKEYTLSAWVFAYDTDADGGAEVRFMDAKGNGIGGFRAPILQDSPFWRELRFKIHAPDGAVSAAVDFNVKFTHGAIWVDDVSLSCDGKELLQNGTFEKR